MAFLKKNAKKQHNKKNNKIIISKIKNNAFYCMLEGEEKSICDLQK